MCLQWLVLSYNDIGPAGGEAIAKGLQVNISEFDRFLIII